VSTATLDDATSYLNDLGYRRILLYVVLGGLVAFYLLPIEAGFVTAFKTQNAFATVAPYLPPPPAGFTMAKWARAFDILSKGLANSLLLAIPATVLSGVLGSMAAYGLTTVDWRGQLAVYVLFLVGIFIPYQAVLVPLSQFWSLVLPLTKVLAPVWAVTGIPAHYGNLLQLILSHVAYGIPICTLLFRAHYKDISEEMIEAARLDGASVSRIYRRIILPLSIPMFAVVFIYQFTQIYNDLLFALIILPSSTAPSAVVTLLLAKLGSGIVTDFSIRMAGAFLAAIPTLLVYVFFGEQFAEGVRA